jgi:hypothetical protein
MTLEASLIVPMAICVIVMIIWGSVFLYDSAILTQDTYILAFRASERADGKKKISPKEYVASKSGQQAGNKYFGCDDPSFSVKTKGKEVIVNGATEVRHSAMGSFFLKIQEGWDIKASMKAKIRNTPKHIRRLKRLKDIGEGI